MSWKLKKKAQSLVAGEEGVVRKEWGGRVSVALVYPNTYAVGMSNLGFQTIYEHLNALPDAVCERVFFPDPEDSDEYARTFSPPPPGLPTSARAPAPSRSLWSRCARSATSTWSGSPSPTRATTSTCCGSSAWRGFPRRRRAAGRGAPRARPGGGGGEGAGGGVRRALRTLPRGGAGGPEAGGDRAAQAAPGHLRA